MNICSIIDNKISYCYFFMFLEQSEHILQLLAFHEWVGSVVQNGPFVACGLVPTR